MIRLQADLNCTDCHGLGIVSTGIGDYLNSPSSTDLFCGCPIRSATAEQRDMIDNGAEYIIMPHPEFGK